MHPQIAINWLAFACSFLAAFVFGFIWYGPLFGKAWAKALGFAPDFKPDKKSMMRAMGLQVLGLLLICYVLTFSTQVWRPSVWGTGTDSADYVYGFFSGFFTWLGFYVPIQLNRVGWEQKTWRLFAINSSYDFLQLQIIAQIIAHM